MQSQNDSRVSGRPKARAQLQYLQNLEQPSTVSNTRPNEDVESSEAEDSINQKPSYEDVERVICFYFLAFIINQM